jgi:Tfp pilus assembly protein PilN
MQALSLDYERKPSRGSRPGLLLLLLGVVAVLIVADLAVEVSREKAESEAALSRTDRKRAPVVRDSERDPKRTAEEMKIADSIAGRLTLPWADLFDALEASSNNTVALLALEPDLPKRVLRITAEAKNKADMLAYVGRLSEDSRLLNVHLMDHQLQAQTPGEPVRFSIQASWAGSTKREQN